MSSCLRRPETPSELQVAGDDVELGDGQLRELGDIQLLGARWVWPARRFRMGSGFPSWRPEISGRPDSGMVLAYFSIGILREPPFSITTASAPTLRRQRQLGT